jgi:hypothetical protein
MSNFLEGKIMKQLTQVDVAGYYILRFGIPPENKYAENIFKNLSQQRVYGLVMVPISI